MFGEINGIHKRFLPLKCRMHRAWRTRTQAQQARECCGILCISVKGLGLWGGLKPYCCTHLGEPTAGCPGTRPWGLHKELPPNSQDPECTNRLGSPFSSPESGFGCLRSRPALTQCSCVALDETAMKRAVQEGAVRGLLTIAPFWLRPLPLPELCGTCAYAWPYPC